MNSHCSFGAAASRQWDIDTREMDIQKLFLVDYFNAFLLDWKEQLLPFRRLEDIEANLSIMYDGKTTKPPNR